MVTVDHGQGSVHSITTIAIRRRRVVNTIIVIQTEQYRAMIMSSIMGAQVNVHNQANPSSQCATNTQSVSHPSKQASNKLRRQVQEYTLMNDKDVTSSPSSCSTKWPLERVHECAPQLIRQQIHTHTMARPESVATVHSMSV